MRHAWSPLDSALAIFLLVGGVYVLNILEEMSKLLEQLKGELTECLFCFDFVSDFDAAKIRNNSIVSYQNKVQELKLKLKQIYSWREI